MNEPPPLIELYSDPDDTALPDLRLAVLNAMQNMGIMPCWSEYYPGQQNVPKHLKKISSPSLFINHKLAWSRHKSGILQPSEPEIQHWIVKYRKEANKVQFKKIIRTHLSFALSLFIAFFPKCPFCWAAYLSIFGLVGSSSIPYKPWFLPLSICLLFINILSLYITRKRHNARPLILSVAGAVIIVLNRMFLQLDFLIFTGGALLVIASLWNSFPKRMSASLKMYSLGIFKKYQVIVFEAVHTSKNAIPFRDGIFFCEN